MKKKKKKTHVEDEEATKKKTPRKEMNCSKNCTSVFVTHCVVS